MLLASAVLPLAMMVTVEATDDGGGAGGLAADIDDQDNRDIQLYRQVGGRTGAVGGAVKQSHDPFADDHVGVTAYALREPGDHRPIHCPAIQIEAGPGGGGVMKGRIDVIGPDLER